MPLPEGLLAVARDLTALDPKRPRQAALRRAVSTAYYALFHLLVQAAVRGMLANQKEREQFGSIAGRAFTHTAIRDIANQLLKPETQRAESLRPLFVGELSDNLTLVCRAFVSAQAAREAADYDLSAIHQRSRVQILVQQVEAAFEAWSKISNTDEGRRFTLAVMIFARSRRI